MDCGQTKGEWWARWNAELVARPDPMAMLGTVEHALGFLRNEPNFPVPEPNQGVENQWVIPLAGRYS
jgi:hypothetical protein